MNAPRPIAAIRRRIAIPLRFADGYTTTANAFTFTGLADGQAVPSQ